MLATEKEGKEEKKKKKRKTKHQINTLGLYADLHITARSQGQIPFIKPLSCPSPLYKMRFKLLLGFRK